jgi:UDP-glucose 4-epimerase
VADTVAGSAGDKSAHRKWRVFLTGAAGRLGAFVRPVLRETGYEFVGVDLRADPALAEVRELNLLDTAAVHDAMKGCDAIVHLGNHSAHGIRPAAQLFNENCVMTMNVFDAARALGIRRIINASTIQVIASEHVAGYTLRDPKVGYLPLDGDSPADPTNTYSLSKHVGEMVLAQWATEMELQAVSLRFPFLMDFNHAKAPVWRVNAAEKEPTATSIAQGFSWLSYKDAARLIAALLEVDWKGARIFLPAAPNPRSAGTVAELIEKYYKGVRRKSSGDIHSLVDISAITELTGWTPLDQIF